MRENCIICGAEIIYFNEQKEMTCDICGKTVFSNASCKNGHFVCDECHEKGGIGTIKEICLASKSKNPIEIMNEIMEQPLIHMHGPEHHIAVGAALLTAYKNCVMKEETLASNRAFRKNLEELSRRGSQIPGGTCGFWGICGVPISTGFFYSLITRTTPLTPKYWQTVQDGVSAAATAVTEYPGPRCCKRVSWLSLKAAIEFTQEHFGVKMEGADDEIVCNHFVRNRECIGQKCPFFKGAK